MSEISKLNGYDIKDKKSIRSYETISSMIADETLKEGQHIKTKGYYEVNDGGHGEYIIVNDTLTEDGGNIHLLNNGLYAKLINENDTINVRKFGAYGDGIHDDTVAIQNAIDSYSEIFIPDGTYMIDASESLVIKSDKNIKLTKNATLKAITNSLESYKIIKIDNVSNISIEGGTIQGERDTHEGSTGEWGLGISIMNGANNIIIKNITLKDCWGDGLYINNAENIFTENIICDNNRRQGLSITNVKKYHSVNDKFINTNGTQPYSGVDIEPNSDSDVIEDVVFDNPYTENNQGRGILIYLSYTNHVNIIINDHNDNGSKYNLGISKGVNSSGEIIINNPIYKNSKETGIQLVNFFDSNCHVIINNPYIDNCNTTDNTASYTAGISCYTELDRDTPLGGVEINNPYITMKEKVSSARAIYVRDNENQLVAKNISIINPRNHQSNLRINIGDGIENFVFEDRHKLYQFDKNESLNISFSNMYSSYINTAFASGRIVTLQSTALINYPYTFTRTNETKYMEIQFPNNQYCKYFDDTNTAPKIRLNYGDSVTLVRINETDWIVTNIVGTPTLQ